jgi:iron complex transport system substrate-binding protein
MFGKGPRYPQRIVCLTEETTETLYLLGLGHLVVGVSGYTVRPKEARQKPRVSSFLDADFEKILALKPDLVLGFSDLQATLGAELCKRGVPVYIFNQRSLDEILQAVRIIGSLVGASREAEALADRLQANLERLARENASLLKRPRLFFEEWPDPLIAGIRWVSELFEVLGADDVCRESRNEHAARGRIYTPEAIAARDPEFVVASWCGRKARKDKIIARPGWDQITAVKEDQLYEVKSAIILQPGPALFTDGAEQVARIVRAVATGEKLREQRPGDLRTGA